ncbi:GNAT family N-acetyltransferase [Acidaminobacter sp. JC074]|uniref:GNAT family N-acetyltransferase n=1 Tax=Acidaminobacter sp. JC074 TaxID=2530199 RepID=UPI001F0FB540|nr:GNAT family N-acetyltransferase [Acidaminobacter sp. JC074]
MKIRNAVLKDLETITNIELECFPIAEAAKKDAIEDRITTFSDGFLVGEVDDKIIGFINGAAFDGMTIKDEYFSDMKYHSDKGKTLAVYGLDVQPDYQHKGYARKLMNAFIEYGKSSQRSFIILTCKEHLLQYYESFGFENNGLSESSHGGAKWYDMTLTL